MRKSMFSLGTMALMSVVVAGCNNSIVATEMPDIPLDSCYTQSEYNHYFACWARDYADSVGAEWDAAPMAGLTVRQKKRERALWENYLEAAEEVYRRIRMNDFCGTAAPMGFAEYRHDLNAQVLASFAYAGKGHEPVANQMVLDEYDGLKAEEVEEIAPGYMKEYSLADKMKAMRAERKAWSRWQAFRAKVSKRLEGEAKTTYDARTNELRRMKLIQLKNRYMYGLMSNDFIELMLDPNCSDEELLQYTNVNQKSDSVERALGL